MLRADAVLLVLLMPIVTCNAAQQHHRLTQRAVPAANSANPPVPTDPPDAASNLRQLQQQPTTIQTVDLERCFGVRGPHCAGYYTQQFEPLQAPVVHNKQCPGNCSSNGVCNGETGICDCPAGVGGVDCSAADLRPCTNSYRSNKSSSQPASHIGPNKRDSNWTETGWTQSRCAGVCDDATGICYCDGPHHGRVPAADGSPPGSPPIRSGRLLHGNCQRLITDDKGQPLHWGAKAGAMSYDDVYGAQGWCTVDAPRVRCSCDMDGVDGELCEVVTETVCPNQCSGHGLCNRGFCQCLPGWYGLDCARISDAVAALTPVTAASSSGDEEAAAAVDSSSDDMDDDTEPTAAAGSMAAAAAALPPYKHMLDGSPHLRGLVVDVWAAAAAAGDGEAGSSSTASAAAAAAAAGQLAPAIPEIYSTPLSADKAESSEMAAAAAAVADADDDAEERNRKVIIAKNQGAAADQDHDGVAGSSSSSGSSSGSKELTSEQDEEKLVSMSSATAAEGVANQQQEQQQQTQRHLSSSSSSSSSSRSLLRHIWTGGGARRDVRRWAPKQQQVTAAVQAWLDGAAAATAAASSSGSSSSSGGCTTLNECLVSTGVAVDRLTSPLDIQLLQHMIEEAMTDIPHGRVRRPKIFVYDMPSRFIGRLLQYRPSKQTCTWRIFSKSNYTLYTTTNAESAWRYPLESHLHELMLQSPHRTLNPEEADFFYVPVYASCFMEAVAGWADTPWWNVHSRSNVKQGVSMYLDALNWIKTTYPYWNETKGSNHIWLFAHDEGACWAPAEIYNNSIILSQWGRMSRPAANAEAGGAVITTSSTSRWEYNYNKADDKDDPQLPDGYVKAIGSHPCYTPSKDLVLPAFKPPPRYHASPFMGGDSRRSRDILLLLRGDLGATRPASFSGGLRQTLAKLAKDGNWKAQHNIWIGTEKEFEGDQSVLLSRSRYCLVVPRDGWSGLFEDAVLHGCIPVVVTGPISSTTGAVTAGGLAQPFSALLRLSSMMVRVLPDELPALPRILNAISKDEEADMRAALSKVWHRMAWLSHPWVKQQAAAMVKDNIRKHPWVQDGLDAQRVQQQAAHQQMGRHGLPTTALVDSTDSTGSELLLPPVSDTTATTTRDVSKDASSNSISSESDSEEIQQQQQQTPGLFDLKVWQPDAAADDAFSTLMQWLHYKMAHPYSARVAAGDQRSHTRPGSGAEAGIVTDR